MTIASITSIRIAIAAVCGVLAGCAEPGAPIRHYVIDTTEQRGTVRQASAQDGPIIAVAPVALPEYLNQNGILTRNSRNEIVRSESHVWAGPLSEEIGRAVAENLSALLPTDRVTLGAVRRILPVDYTVDIEIVQFERTEATNAVDLVARWVVFRGDERTVLAMRRSQLHTPVAGTEYQDTAAAMSDALGALSEEIASAIMQTRDRRKSDRLSAERMSRNQGGNGGAAPARRR
ncbi:MAG TPA: PqiC family protein [Alphaproteobacteria bacterium]